MNVAIIDLLVQLNQSINTGITCFSMTIMTTLVIVIICQQLVSQTFSLVN